MADARQFCTFYLDDLYFGVAVETVQEVLRYQDMTYVPLASAVIGGLINLRGQIVTAIDLRQRLQMNDRPEGRLPMNVVVRTDDGVVTLLVDGIGDVVEVADELFEEAPQTMTGPARELVRGVYKLEDTILLILNTEKAVAVADLAAVALEAGE